LYPLCARMPNCPCVVNKLFEAAFHSHFSSAADEPCTVCAMSCFQGLYQQFVPIIPWVQVCRLQFERVHRLEKA
jgi:hypothetical protein